MALRESRDLEQLVRVTPGWFGSILTASPTTSIATACSLLSEALGTWVGIRTGGIALVA